MTKDKLTAIIEAHRKWLEGDGGARGDLQGADLRGAVLQDADLRNADLQGADLQGADLQGAVLSPHAITPEVGAFRAFKKLANGTICELEIPADAARTSSYVGRKCRAEYAVVIWGEGMSPQAPRDAAPIYYAPGATVRPDSYDPDPRVECSHGIHFFITRAEAEQF